MTTSAPIGEAALAVALLAPDHPAPAAVGDARRFSVYRNNVAVSLIDAIAATFPAVQALVGEAFFRAAAREFVLGHPPSSPVLIEYGGAFPDWIAAFPPASGVPYLGDVARIEWAWNRAYNAAEAAPLDGARLAAPSPERLAASRVVFHPSMSWIASRYPAASLWAEATGRAPSTDLDLTAAETALIVRPGETVDVRAISPGMVTFLNSLAAGAAIGEAVEGLDDDPALAAECLTALFQLGLVTDLVGPEAGSEQADEDRRGAG